MAPKFTHPESHLGTLWPIYYRKFL
ncbi:uncharacterized protein G2W53_035109 [Senna tora]|uniref:Uncharacterized protein n=1 Tax=Senna tora TaxID=362788 RepID=A0A834SRS7_9FABA|nr:uncharacterized protein G2W53_035109 [Senna tora]